jgi:hypothetical protein
MNQKVIFNFYLLFLLIYSIFIIIKKECEIEINDDQEMMSDNEEAESFLDESLFKIPPAFDPIDTSTQILSTQLVTTQRSSPPLIIENKEKDISFKMPFTIEKTVSTPESDQLKEKTKIIKRLSTIKRLKNKRKNNFTFENEKIKQRYLNFDPTITFHQQQQTNIFSSCSTDDPYSDSNFSLNKKDMKQETEQQQQQQQLGPSPKVAKPRRFMRYGLSKAQRFKDSLHFY